MYIDVDTSVDSKMECLGMQHAGILLLPLVPSLFCTIDASRWGKVC